MDVTHVVVLFCEQKEARGMERRLKGLGLHSSRRLVVHFPKHLSFQSGLNNIFVLKAGYAQIVIAKMGINENK